MGSQPNHQMFIVRLLKAFSAFCTREQANATLQGTKATRDLPMAETNRNRADQVYQTAKHELLAEDRRLGGNSPLPMLRSAARRLRGQK